MSYEGIDPNKSVTKEQLAQRVGEIIKEEKGFVVVKTSDEDLKTIAELLDIPQGLDKEGHYVKFIEGAESCSSCGRHYSFLDLVHSGFGAHNKEFMRDVLLAKYGNVINPNKPNLHKCYNCDKPAAEIMAAYCCCFCYCC